MLKYRQIIMDNLHWVIGNGDRVNVEEDSSIPGLGKLKDKYLNDGIQAIQIPKLAKDHIIYDNTQ